MIINDVIFYLMIIIVGLVVYWGICDIEIKKNKNRGL